MVVIGITGTLGAGKGTVVEYLLEQGFVHFSVRGYLAGVLADKGIPVNRDSLTRVANELRSQHGPAYIVDQLYAQALLSGKNCVIESIRTPGEIISLKAKGPFVLFAVDARPETRYRRIVKRNSETDHISYETFLANEKREMSSTDPNKQNLAECIRMADFCFKNNGTIGQLFAQVQEAVIQVNNQPG